MPYLALLNDKGKEVSAPGYVRRDLADVRFKMSPSPNLAEIVFVNASQIDFAAEFDWGWVAQIGLCDEVCDDAPYALVPLEHASSVPAGHIMRVPPGQLTIYTQQISPRGRKTPEPEPVKRGWFARERK